MNNSTMSVIFAMSFAAMTGIAEEIDLVGGNGGFSGTGPHGEKLCIEGADMVMRPCRGGVNRDSEQAIRFGSMTDVRDGTTYRTIVAGGLTWMADNLRFAKDSSWCQMESDQKSCEKHGRLYRWEAIADACPEGWRIPSAPDWGELAKSAGGIEHAGRNLKAANAWDGENEVRDPLGFGVGATGIRFFDTKRNRLVVAGIGQLAGFWSATPNSDGNVTIVDFSYGNDSMLVGSSQKRFALNLRCVRK